MARKAILLFLFFALFAADTVYFGARCAAGVFWLRGERRMFNNDLKRAWRSFEWATTCRGNSARIETEMAELLLMGLDELAAGVQGKLPLDPDASLKEAFALLGSRISAEPFNAYSWSQVSDLYMHAAARRRRSETPPQPCCRPSSDRGHSPRAGPLTPAAALVRARLPG